MEPLDRLGEMVLQESRVFRAHLVHPDPRPYRMKSRKKFSKYQVHKVHKDHKVCRGLRVEMANREYQANQVHLANPGDKAIVDFLDATVSMDSRVDQESED